MAVDDLMTDDIFIETAGQMRGPFKASVQGNKVYIGDETVVIDEGDRIFRVLPNGKSESHLVLQVDFHKDPFDGPLSHYEVTTRRESSQARLPKR